MICDILYKVETLKFFFVNYLVQTNWHKLKMSHNTIKFTLYAILIYTDEPCDKIDDTDEQPEQNGKVDKQLQIV